jgi:hypothetical protein
MACEALFASDDIDSLAACFTLLLQILSGSCHVTRTLWLVWQSHFSLKELVAKRGWGTKGGVHNV